MYVKPITYTDYNGETRTETFYFNLSKAELLEMELSSEGGFAERTKRILESRDIPSLVKIFKQFILDSYGEKSADGKRFVKNAELTEAFSQTEAYSVLFMELATDAEAAAKFMNGIVPSDLAKQVANLPKDSNGMPIVADTAKLNQ